MEEQKRIRESSDEDEIDLIEIGHLLWGKRKSIIKAISVFFVIGVLIALLSPVEYEASCKLMPEIQQQNAKGNLGGLGSLAGLAGINLDLGATGVLTPELYPEITQSAPFQISILNTSVYFESSDTTVSPQYFFNNIKKPSVFSYISKYTFGLPSTIKSLFESEAKTTFSDNPQDGLLRLSEADALLINGFKKRIIVSVDSKTSIITVSVLMPDAYASAAIAQKVILLLTDEITKYKIEKATLNLDFVQQRFEESKREFVRKQEALAVFTDRNKNLSSAIAQTEYQRLQNEYNIAYEVYKSLATQLEQAKIKVKEETPVFTVLEPVKIPLEKSKPRRKLIVAIALGLGGFFAICWVLGKDYILPKIKR